MASFVQFLVNFGTKTYKKCTKNGIFLLYLWISVIFYKYIMLLLGIYLINFIAIWYVYLHKLPPHWCIQYTLNINYMVFHTISLCVKQKLYDISCNFIMCRIRDFALFLVKICRIIQKYPPLCRKDFYQKTFPYFVYNIQKYL